ncbi:MAG TPA: tetratricopeptide repeat protein, partial [Thermoanaerobaculia bacterium]|nr:tetratricopeptide repeat protein [Thermoanaerobaculia bacterium]
IALLEALAREAPESPLVHAALGRAFLQRLVTTRDASWAPLARSYCERARQLAPRRPEVEVTLAQLAIRTGDPGRAVPLLRHALSVQPANSEAMLALAQAWDAMGDGPAAEEAFRRLLALQPGYWAAYSKLGGYYFKHGRFRDAAQMFRRVTELNPDSARGFSNLGAALTASGDFEGALAAAQRSVALEETGSGFANLGTQQFYLGRFADAARSFERATRLMPASLDVWLNLADCYRWSPGREHEATEAYRKAIALGRQQLDVNAGDTSVRIHLAMALAKVGELAAAEEELRRDDAGTAGPEGLYASALVASLGGRNGDAMALLERAVTAGYDRNLLSRDPELGRLRGERDFSKLLGEGRRAA